MTFLHVHTYVTLDIYTLLSNLEGEYEKGKDSKKVIQGRTRRGLINQTKIDDVSHLTN